jgi:hypothetical protein
MRGKNLVAIADVLQPTPIRIGSLSVPVRIDPLSGER